MIIGVDIDGTIKNTHEAAVRCFNDELDKTVRCEDVKEFHLDTAYGLSRNEGRRLWRKLEPRIYSLGVPLENAAEVLTDLKQKGHEIAFITARPGFPEVARVTRKWLTEHGFPYDGENLHMNSQDKARVARKLDVGLFFEDAPQHLDRLVDAGVPTVIMDAVYNRDYPGDVPRITRWDEAYGWVEKYERTAAGKPAAE